MKAMIAALTITAATAAQAEVFTTTAPIVICREAITVELIASRLSKGDPEGAMLVAREGGCIGLEAGTGIDIISANEKMYRVQANFQGTILPGYVSRPRSL